jgi:hypothetical protein
MTAATRCVATNAQRRPCCVRQSGCLQRKWRYRQAPTTAGLVLHTLTQDVVRQRRHRLHRQRRQSHSSLSPAGTRCTCNAVRAHLCCHVRQHEPLARALGLALCVSLACGEQHVARESCSGPRVEGRSVWEESDAPPAFLASAFLASFSTRRFKKSSRQRLGCTCSTRTWMRFLISLFPICTGSGARRVSVV